MAVDIKILGWAANGLRCPDHDISFINGESTVHKITLIQMPNGTGKTTTLKLLRAALAGPEIWSQGNDKPLQFRKNRTVQSGTFELRLLYNKSRRLTILMEFDFTDSGKVQYYTTGSSGKDEGFNIPSALRSVLTPDFVKLLIFDGELAANLLDAESTNAQNAIEAMYQLYFFSRVKDRINEFWNNKATEAGSKGGQKEYTIRSNRLLALDARIKKVTEERDADYKNLADVTSKISDLKSEFESEIAKHGEFNRQLTEVTGQLRYAERVVAEKSLAVVTLMKNPAELNPNFANEIIALKGSLDRVKLPGIAAREFFEEIADEDDCICGRPIDHEVKAAINNRAKKYLGSEEVSVLNAMKSDIKDKVEANELASHSLPELIRELEAAQENQLLAKQNFDTFKELAGDRDPKIADINKKLEQLNTQKGRLSNIVLKYEDKTTDSDQSWNLDILNKRYDQAERDLSAVTETIKLKDQKDILTRILDNAFEQSRQAVNADVCLLANERIAKLMPNNDIKIASIERSLRLVDKDGGSAGETLTVGYSFLSSLLDNQNYSLPSVVDSPSGPIDLKIRPEIARLIPNFADQFVAFTISSEREGFIKPMTAAAPGQIQFLTLFRKDKGELEAGAKATKTYQETDDGIWLSDQNYFVNFHIDEQY